MNFRQGRRWAPLQVWELRMYDRKNYRKPKNRGKHNSRIIVSPDQQNWELSKRNLNCLLHVQNRVGNSAGNWKIAPSTSEAVFAPRIYLLIVFEIFRPAETWKQVKWFRSATPLSSTPLLAKQNPSWFVALALLNEGVECLRKKWGIKIYVFLSYVSKSVKLAGGSQHSSPHH